MDDTVFKAMNDVDFPVAKVIEGIDVAAAAGRKGNDDTDRFIRIGLGACSGADDEHTGCSGAPNQFPAARIA